MARRSPCLTRLKPRKPTLNTVRKKKVGNPLLRIEVLTTLGSGAVLGYVVTPYKGRQTGETTLFRQLVGQLKAGDIVLGDAIFENYDGTLESIRSDTSVYKHGESFFVTPSNGIAYNGIFHCRLSNSGASPRDFRYAVKLNKQNAELYRSPNKKSV